MNIKNAAFLFVFLAAGLAVGWVLVNAGAPKPALAQSTGSGANMGERPGEAAEGAVDQPAPPSTEPGASPEILESNIVVMGFEITPKTGTYAVTADANVRKGPGIEHGKIGSLKQGERVQAIGQPEGKTWYAVSQNDKLLGFVFSKILIPVVDGTLFDETRGVLMQHGSVCDYRLRFEGKTTVEGGKFDTSDYEIRFRCAGETGSVIFYSHMFLTEAATNKRYHQLSMDVRSIGDGMEKYLTTNYLYDPGSGDIKFDGHSIAKFATVPEVKTMNAKTLKGVLLLVMETSVSSWTDDAWDSLFAKGEN